MKIKVVRSCFVFLAIGLGMVNTNVLGQDGKLQVALPKGDWKFSAVPEASTSNHKVEAYSVKTEAQKGLAITEVGIWNGGVETVTSLRLSWKLSSIRRGQQVQLFDGKSPVLEVNIKPGQKAVLNYQLTAFSDFTSNLASRGQLTDAFLIGVTVEDVGFATGKPIGMGQVQKIGYTLDSTPLRRCPDPNRVSFVKASLFVKASFDEACQDQICQWNGSDCFRCAGGPGFGCSTSSCGSCTNSRCVPILNEVV